MKSALLTLCKTGEILIVLWIAIFVRHVRAFTTMRENSIITQSNDDTSTYESSLSNDNSSTFNCYISRYSNLPLAYIVRSAQLTTESIIWTPCNKSIEMSCRYANSETSFHFTPYTVPTKWYHLPNETVLDGSKRLDDFDITKNSGLFKHLYLPLISTNDIGWYTVVYNDSKTFNTRSVYINVTCGDTTDKSQAETVQKIQNGASPPYFLGNKNDALNIDIESKEISMKCFGRGYPIPRCQWFENNIPISSSQQQRPSSCVIEKSPKPGHSANYTCSWENSNGSINRTFVVDVKDQPPVLINSSQRNITLRLGQSINLTCEFSTTSQPWLTYWKTETWSLKTKSLILSYGLSEYSPQTPINREVYYDGDTTKITTTFQLNNVTGFSEGSYTCFASNINGITRQQISVTVVNEQGTRKAPRLLNATPNITIDRGESVQLKCEFSFDSLPTNVIWQPQSSPKLLFAKHTVFTPFTFYNTYISNRSTIVTVLPLTHYGPMEDSMYKCVASNTAGTVEHLINVQSARGSSTSCSCEVTRNREDRRFEIKFIEISETPINISASCDSTIRCKCTGPKLPFTNLIDGEVGWIRAKTTDNAHLLEDEYDFISSGRPVSVENPNEGTDRTAMELKHLTTFDNGFYILALDPFERQRKIIFSLQVTCDDEKYADNQLLERIQNGQGPPYFVQNPVETSCPDDNSSPTGNQTSPRLCLRCISRGYPKPHLTNWYHNDRLIAARNRYMPANGWQSNDTGSYTCESCNNNGCTSNTFDVHITGEKPVLTSSLSTIYLRLGESANLTCECTSSSTPWYTQWHINGVKFSPKLLHYEPNTSQIISFPLKNFTKNNAGIYTCVASNLNGIIYRDISVNLKHSEALQDQLVSMTEHNHTIIIISGFSIILSVLLAFAYYRIAKKQNSREICAAIPFIRMINKENEVELDNNPSYLLTREN